MNVYCNNIGWGRAKFWALERCVFSLYNNTNYWLKLLPQFSSKHNGTLLLLYFPSMLGIECKGPNTNCTAIFFFSIVGVTTFVLGQTWYLHPHPLGELLYTRPATCCLFFKCHHSFLFSFKQRLRNTWHTKKYLTCRMFTYYIQ